MLSSSLRSKHEKGQGLVEYAIILALVAVVVIAAMRILGPKVGNTFSTINNAMDSGDNAIALTGSYEGDCQALGVAQGQTVYYNWSESKVSSSNSSGTGEAHICP